MMENEVMQETFQVQTVKKVPPFKIVNRASVHDDGIFICHLLMNKSFGSPEPTQDYILDKSQFQNYLHFIQIGGV